VTKKIGIDIGGTFTDIIIFDQDTGKIEAYKVLTDRDSPSKNCVAALKDILPADAWPKVTSFLYSTTVALNAILERKGSRIGLLCTKGHRDTMEIARGTRADPYNLFWHPKKPLAARRHRIGVDERIVLGGHVRTPLNEDEVKEAAKWFNEEEVESVAIAFLHSYANPDHELRAGELLREAGFTGEITLSHQISGEYREYERTSTALINAYIQSRIKQELADLEAGLGALGFRGALFTTRSGGGAMDVKEAIVRPFETINSGPVAGAEGAALLARELELDGIVAADVGGTSFDATLIQGGEVPILYEGTIELMPIQSPWVDVRSIGAGGGSIAWIDGGGLMQVGPQSAGADPGPACYGRGGEEATVMDAAMYLGMLGADRSLGGVPISRDLARSALEPLAGALGLSLDATAIGIIRIAAAKMADAIREITIECGKDPRQMALLGFGGAGPLLATNLAHELEISNILVPPLAGNFSACGLLGASLVRASSYTRILPLNEEGIAEVNKELANMLTELESRGGGDGSDGDLEPRVSLELRYKGQEHTLSIPGDLVDDRLIQSAGDFEKAFIEDYKKIFVSVLDDWPLEVVTIRAALQGPSSRDWFGSAMMSDDDSGDVDTARAYSFALGEYVEFPAVERADLSPGTKLDGPMIIVEATTTTYVDHGYTVLVERHGCLVITDEESK